MDYMTDGKAVEIRTEDGRVVVGPGALELISSWEWLQEANRNARRGKRTRPSIMQYQDDLEHNLIQTGEEMRAGTYRTGPYRRLWVYIPKRRLVMALDYRDRVVQWSVYQLLYPYFDRRMIPAEHKDGIDMARELLRRSHVLIVCGDEVDEAVKNDIAVAQRLGITATTLDGILKIRSQGHEEPR